MQADLQKSMTSSLVDSFRLMGNMGYKGLPYLPTFTGYRLVAFSGSLKYGGNFSPDVFMNICILSCLFQLPLAPKSLSGRS
jgi:hypothetical protein